VDGGTGLDHSGWLEAGQLQPGDLLRTAAGKHVTVTALHWNVGDAEVYTLTVASDHTFFVGSARVLVHNDACRIATAINGATRTVPLGFQEEQQFMSAVVELHAALRASGISDATIGVRGSSVTGVSLTKGTSFHLDSDIDFFVESGQLTEGFSTSRNIPGFVHPGKFLSDYPLLQEWATTWGNTIGRRIILGAFTPGALPSQPAIVVL
jgi:hypothetical protein